ncbi:hypothetical protein fh0823_26780 [Francisella halioticida]|nr:hypothetical protein fh0823_26780 [Francisella halioticida]
MLDCKNLLFTKKLKLMENINSGPGLFSAIAIGVGCIIGSGWLFAAYYASRQVGSASIIILVNWCRDGLDFILITW